MMTMMPTLMERYQFEKKEKTANSKTTGLTADNYSSPEENNSSEGEDNDDNDLNYSDQSDYNNYSVVDSDDDLHTSFQKNKSPNLNRVQGGPSKPDVSNMSDSDAAAAMNKFKVEQKKMIGSNWRNLLLTSTLTWHRALVTIMIICII
jgi:hypothetical protein